MCTIAAPAGAVTTSASSATPAAPAVPAVLQPSTSVAGVSGGGPDLQAAIEQLWGAVGSLRGALEGRANVAGGGGSGCTMCQAAQGAGAIGASTPAPAPTTSGGGDVPAPAPPPVTEPPSAFAAAGTRLVHPLEGARMSSPYGDNSAFRGGRGHSGTDFAKAEGSPIVAAAAGTIAKVGFEADGLGHYVEIDHGNGWATRYGHMVDVPPVKQGDAVQAGGHIGDVGSTGNSTGPHVHFMVLKDGKHEDPQPFLDGAKTF